MGGRPATLELGVLIGVGGFAGASLRYAVAGVLPGLAGTLAVNVAGSFLLGLVVYRAVYATGLAPRTRAVVGTGFLSSFTTYSTFAVETAGATLPVAAGNVLATYGLGFAGVLAGRALARRTGDAATTDATATAGGDD